MNCLKLCVCLSESLKEFLRDDEQVMLVLFACVCVCVCLHPSKCEKSFLCVFSGRLFEECSCASLVSVECLCALS